MTRDHLEQSGFRVLPAMTAKDIFNALSTTPVRAVVLDSALRGADGLDLCRDVRERSHVPIILVGADSSEVDRVVGLELGADDYIAKPFGTRELIARIRAILRRVGVERGPDEHRESEAHFDGWSVNFPRRELRSPTGAIVDLTGAEFDLLGSFLSHPQRVIARERLIELSRTRMGDSSDRSIDVLVSRLRRKLSTQEKGAPITTVRGVGYMFNAEVSRA